MWRNVLYYLFPGQKFEIITETANTSKEKHSFVQNQRDNQNNQVECCVLSVYVVHMFGLKSIKKK